MRDDLRDPDAVDYEQRLLVWPVIGYAVAMAIGGLAAATAGIAGRVGRVVARLEAPALGVLAYAGLLVALTGTRWLGFYWARLADEQPPLVHLDVVPYLNLATGLAFVATAWLLSRHTRGWPVRDLLPAAAAALSLLLLPLVPLGQVHFPGGAFRLDALTLAILGEHDAGFGAPESLGLARWMLWACLYASAVAAATTYAAGSLPEPVPWLRRAGVANIVFVVVGAGATMAFYVRLPDLRPGTSVGANPVLPLAWLVLGALWWMQCWPGAKRRSL